MPGHMILLNLLGGIALLIWGTGMVKSGFLRTFGGALRRILARATDGPLRAAAAGLGAAAGLQSSTATAMLLSAFVARGLIALAPALAVMLGADLGTTLVVQVLAFDLSGVIPVLLVAGVALAQLARGNRALQIGRILLGFGLMILALSLIVQASQPMRESEVMHLVLERLGADPILALLVAAGLTWLFHSSVAFVLLVMSLTGAGVIGLPLAVVLVLGANLGAGLVPLGLTAGSPMAARRVLYGNLAFRALGALAALAFAGPLASLAAALPGGVAHQVAHLHTLFNLALVVICLPLTSAAARLLARALGDEPEESGQTRRLEDGLLDRPALALTAAKRELLAMADTLEAMLQRTLPILETGDEREIEAVRGLEQTVDATQEELQLYLVRLLRQDLDREQSARVTELLMFSTNLEHVGDIIDKGLVRLAQKKQRLEVDFSEEGWRDLRVFHARVLDQLRLALAVFVSRDADTARELVAEKDRLREFEAEATRRHLARLRDGTSASIETSGLHLDVLRDLKRIAAHLTAVAHPLLEEQGVLRASRLKSDKKRLAPAPASEPG